MSLPPFRGDDAALSSILGAILLFGLTVSTITTLQVQYVPVWDEKREGQLMDELSGEMMLLQADIAGQVAGRTGVPLARPLTLAPPSGFSFFTGSTEPGSLAFEPFAAGSGLRLDAPSVTIQHSGEDLHVLSETWKSITPTTPDVVQVARVDHFRLRITNPTALLNDQHITARVFDKDGHYAGKIVVVNREPTGSDYSLVVKVFAAGDEATATPITQVTDGWKKQTDVDTYFVDALNPSLGFSAVLAAADEPLRLDWDTTMSGASAALVFTDAATGAGSPSGLLVTPFSHTVGGGRVVAERENQQFPAQRYVLEYGALLLEQPDGAAMVAAPDFAAHVSGANTVLSFAVPVFTGVPDTVASRTARLASAPAGVHGELVLFSAQLGFTLATDHPGVWEDYFEEVLHDAGLQRGLHYSLAPVTDGLALQVFGSAATTAQDVTLRFTDASLAVSLLASG